MGAGEREKAAPRKVAAAARSRPGLRIASASDLLTAAARAVLDDLREQVPDLRSAVVLLPTLHAGGEFARALASAADGRALLLPRITTLAHWAEDVVLDARVVTRAAREAMLYRVLAQRDWIRTGNLWTIAAELASLFDELTREAVALPRDVKEFTRQLEKAYRARSSAPLNFEARVVHDLWHAAAAPGDGLDPQAAYHARLAKLAREVAVPVYAVGLCDLSQAEEQFLMRAAERVSVTRFAIDEAVLDPVARTLRAAWAAGEQVPALIERASALSASEPASALAGRFRIFEATSAEEEAQAIDLTVREWLLQGRKSIAVVVNDRLVARRARALLERAQVLVEDEAGWAFSTTSAATAIGRWLDVVANDCYHRDLFDLMKSPFAFSDRPRDHRQAAVWRLEKSARKASVASGLKSFIAIANESKDHEVLELLRRVERSIAAFGRGRRPIARWLERLDLGLGHVGIAQGLARDAAGAQLLELIEALRNDLASEPLTIAFPEWRRWFSRELENATFRDTAIASPVVFTSLAAAQLRRFDGVLLIGCDAAHLPGPEPASIFLNQHVRAELGLRTGAERVARIEHQLVALFSASQEIAATWQCQTAAGEPGLLSPHLERLSAIHGRAYGDDLVDRTLRDRLRAASVRSSRVADPPLATAVPQPAVHQALVPRRISASGYNSLLACPYQFFVRHVLKLAELDDVQEEVEKRDYGKLVHDVLAEFHRTHPRVTKIDAATARAALEALSRDAFGALMSHDYHARAWLMRWLALVPAYLDWQRAHEAAGWRWHGGELPRRIELETPKGRRYMLDGRLDRVDARSDGTYAVIDYKTQARKGLVEKARADGEDVQLPVYALLWPEAVSGAMFLALEREGVAAVPVEGDVSALADAARLRLGELYDAVHEGAKLKAQGVESVCEYCEARGLCRRNFWP